MVPAKGKYGHVSRGKGAVGSSGGGGSGSGFSKSGGTSGAATSAKSKEMKRERPFSDTEDSDSEESQILPDVKPFDHVKQMPRFTNILSRAEENAISMEDLDTLQMELESFLNAVVIRSLTLQREIAGMTDKPSKAGQSFLKGPLSPGKRSKLEERSPKKIKDQGKAADALTPPLGKPAKMKSTPKPTLDTSIEEFPPVENMRATTSKNDTPNKFWSSVEPYCASFTEDDLKLIEDLISAHHDDEEYLKIPPLGRHYTLRWAEDDLHQEQREGSRFGEKKKTSTNNASATEDAQRMLDLVAKNSGEGASNTNAPAICGPLTQRLISALMEENIVTSLQDTIQDSEGVDENAKSTAASKGTMTTSQAAALERRIRQELEEQGILAADEANSTQADDEILTELRRCQGELRAISQHNLQHLKKLQMLAQEEMKRQDVRKKLMTADTEVLDIYRKMASAKQKKRPITKKEKEQAWKTLREREAIVKQLDTG